VVEVEDSESNPDVEDGFVDDEVETVEATEVEEEGDESSNSSPDESKSVDFFTPPERECVDSFPSQDLFLSFFFAAALVFHCLIGDNFFSVRHSELSLQEAEDTVDEEVSNVVLCLSEARFNFGFSSSSLLTCFCLCFVTHERTLRARPFEGSAATRLFFLTARGIGSSIE